jgi:hypothetical protein
MLPSNHGNPPECVQRSVWVFAKSVFNCTVGDPALSKAIFRPTAQKSQNLACPSSSAHYGNTFVLHFLTGLFPNAEQLRFFA